MQTRLLAVDQVAQILGITKHRTYELIRIGLLPSVKLGRQVKVAEDKLTAWIDAGGRELPGGWRRDP